MEISGKLTKLKKKKKKNRFQEVGSGVIAMATVGTEEIGASKDDVDEV